MYWELEEKRSKEDQDSYILLGGEKATKPSIVDKIATSKPAVVIDKFNRSFMDLLVSSTGFVAALSWNEWIKSLFQEGGIFFKSVGRNGLLYVALFVTVLAYIMTVVVTSLYPDRPIASKNNPIEASVKEDYGSKDQK
jgi:hypothetical protein